MLNTANIKHMYLHISKDKCRDRLFQINENKLDDKYQEALQIWCQICKLIQFWHCYQSGMLFACGLSIQSTLQYSQQKIQSAE